MNDFRYFLCRGHAAVEVGMKEAVTSGDQERVLVYDKIARTSGIRFYNLKIEQFIC
jgi:hypothetical protein